ncbi:hypothetical protein NA57DRAFT_76361 [Rhizodiscina lignyota]|uniref:BTB domain-containing protein n=1 Tax=Rhizodiscina lignyota TaxID=1504668 RepID=A0A9P4IH08_9PEZI|nr:hypothetical protein NA57DRAFT_76361 [Rhizodiscina lignyota]
MSSTNILEIAPEGDVIFIAGTAERARRLRVSSHILSIASPVFRNMFSTKYSEGQGLSGDDPKEIPLPEDDPLALELFCAVTHLQGKRVSEYSLSPALLRSYAILVDKYDAYWSVFQSLELWFKDARLQWPPGAGRVILLDTAYILNDHRHFLEFSNLLMVMTPVGDGDELLLHETLLPKTLLTMMIQRAQTARQMIVEAINKTLTWCIGGSMRGHDDDCKLCNWNLRHMLECLEEQKLWPPEMLPSAVATCVLFATVAKDVTVVANDLAPCAYSECANDRTSLQLIRDAAKEANALCRGLCLDCFRAGEKMTDGSCRMQHD